jgi:protein-S-isoprenylcysteine O-methyltransferase Ste14
MALQEEFKSQGDFLFKNRSYIPLIVLLVALIQIYFQANKGLDSHWPFSYNGLEITGIVIAFIGFFIRVVTIGQSAKNTSGRNTSEGQVADHLNTSGIYSTVRHPLYVGNFFMWLGPAIMTQNLWFVLAFILFYWVYYERIMYAEEQFLRGKFKDAYLNWSKQVPAFVPKLSAYRSSDLDFTWKKVIKKEKNGFAAIFIVFAVFRAVHDYGIYGKATFEAWIYTAAIVGVIIYLIIKYTRKFTHLFDEDDR